MKSEWEPDNHWRPGASRLAMEARAALLADVRKFFSDRKVMEVETPVLSKAGNSDPNIRNISTDSSAKKFMRTSPEYAMKRLLASATTTRNLHCSNGIDSGGATWTWPTR